MAGCGSAVGCSVDLLCNFHKLSTMGGKRGAATGIFPGLFHSSVF